MKTRILIVENHKAWQRKLRSLLEKIPDFEVVGVAEDGLSAIQMADSCHPHVMLTDITLPGINGLETIRRVHTTMPNILAVIVTLHTDSSFVHKALEVGAKGYVVKDHVLHELEPSIRSALQDEIYISAHVQDDNS